MIAHEVQQGECLNSIAHDYNYLWETLWNDPSNAQLKQTRQDPNILYPGDIVNIPDTDLKEEERPVDAQHSFQLNDDDCKLRVRLLRNDEPRAGETYKLTVDGNVIDGQTDGDGWVDQPISPDAQSAVLTLPDTNEEYALDLGHLDPLTTISGVQQRLQNLGFYIGDDADGVMGPNTESGVRAFQKKYSLTIDGDPTGTETQAKLKDVYGS